MDFEELNVAEIRTALKFGNFVMAEPYKRTWNGALLVMKRKQCGDIGDGSSRSLPTLRSPAIS